MRGLTERLDRLERESVKGRKDAQCAYCERWGPRVQTIDVDGSVTLDTPDVPEQCPRCGWTPVFVTFEIIDDWRNVGRAR